MNNKTKLVILAIVLVLLIAGAGVLYNFLSDKVDIDKTTTDNNSDQDLLDAPDFTVYDKNGNEVKLSDFKGKPVFITFWASWCGVCKAEMPDIQTVYEQYGDKVEFMMINCTDGTQETMESANEFLGTVDYTFPVYYDTTLEAGIKYYASALPTSYFINADGKLIGRGAYLDLQTLHQAIGDIMG